MPDTERKALYDLTCRILNSQTRRDRDYNGDCLWQNNGENQMLFLGQKLSVIRLMSFETKRLVNFGDLMYAIVYLKLAKRTGLS